MVLASAAAISRAVITISRARIGPTVATSSARLAGAAKLPSVRAMGAPKRACSAASRRSQASAMNMPPPTASPWIMAIVGLRDRGDAVQHAADPRLVAERVLRVLNVWNWRMSVPLTKALSPLPRRMTTRTDVVGVEPVAEIVQALVHLEGHRVARLGPVDGDDGDAVVSLEGEMVGDGLDHGAHDSASARGACYPRRHDLAHSCPRPRRRRRRGRPTRCSCTAWRCCVASAPASRATTPRPGRGGAAAALAAAGVSSACAAAAEGDGGHAGCSVESDALAWAPMFRRFRGGLLPLERRPA